MSATPEPPRRRRSARRLGLQLLAGALICFLLISWDPVIPAAFGVILAGTGWGLIFGGLDPAARMLPLIDRAPRQITRHPRTLPAAPVEFRYPPAGCIPSVTIWLCGSVPILLGTMLAVLSLSGKLDLRAGLVLGPIFAAGGGLLIWWFSRFKRALVIGGPEGIEVRTPFTCRSIRWDDVTALEWSSLQNAAGAPLTALIRVHSRETFVRVEYQLTGFAELQDVIRGATGLDWA